MEQEVSKTNLCAVPCRSLVLFYFVVSCMEFNVISSISRLKTVRKMIKKFKTFLLHIKFQPENLNIKPELLEWFTPRHVYALEWPSQSEDLNLILILYQDMEMYGHRSFLSSLTEPELFVKKSRERFKYQQGQRHTHKDWHLFFYIFIKILKNDGVLSYLVRIIHV